MDAAERFFNEERYSIWERTISSLRKSPGSAHSLEATLDTRVSSVRLRGFSLVRDVYAELHAQVADRSGVHPVEIVPAFYLGSASWPGGAVRDEERFSARLREAYGLVGDARAYFARRGVDLSVRDALAHQSL